MIGMLASTRPTTSIPSITFLPSFAASARTKAAAGACAIGPTLTDAAAVSLERTVDGLVPGNGTCAGEQLVRILRLAKDAVAQQRDARGPGGAVLATVLGPELRAERDQLAHVRNGLDRARGGEADEPLRVQVVAQQENRVPVARGEETGAAVVDEIALVDRLDGHAEAGLGERREDRHAVAGSSRAQRLLPERALTLGLERDLLPEVKLGSQLRPPASGRSPRRRGRARRTSPRTA